MNDEDFISKWSILIEKYYPNNKMNIEEIRQKMTEKSAVTENSRDYKARASVEYNLNMAYYKILSDYFNIVYQHPDLQEKHDITDISFLRYKDFLGTVDLVSFFGETNIVFRHMGTMFNFAFDKYRQRDELFYTLIISSKEAIEIDGEEIYEKILNHALQMSDLKGSYIEMPRNEFTWKKRELEQRGFNDIFLPKNLMEDLELYVKVFKIKGKAMRYLMVGSPGTGKTESTLILANELNKAGVTILKTPVCDILKEKLELAHVLAPSLLLFDDLDLSIGSRTKGGYSPKELQEFLDALDGTDKMENNVGLIATTNSTQLLDLAAQRPGRFEKILSFDGLSKKNIGNIILKSLKYNFDITRSTHPEIVNRFYNKKVIDALYAASVSGAYVYNSVNVINLKAEMSEKEITDDWVLSEITEELNIAEKIRKSDHLTDVKMKHSKGGVGFGKTSIADEDEEINFNEDDQCVEAPLRGEPRIRRDSSETERG